MCMYVYTHKICWGCLYINKIEDVFLYIFIMHDNGFS